MPTATQLVVSTTSPEEILRLAGARMLYGILDACDQPQVPVLARELGEERAVSLYRGEAEKNYWDIAPYLVRLDEDLVEWIFRSLWEEPWGIFVVTDAALDELRRHFRRFLLVEDTDGDEAYFRFYDPRVLRAFLPNCTAEELDSLFGPVLQYGAHSADDHEITLMTR